MPASLAVPTEPPQTTMRLNTGSSEVSHVIFLDKPDQWSMVDDQVLAAITCDKFHIFKNESTADKPFVDFPLPRSPIVDIAELENGVVAAVSTGGELLTWGTDGGEKVGVWDHSHSLRCVAKLGDSKIIVGDRKGGLTFYFFETATLFRVHRSFPDAHRDCVRDIAVHGNSFVTFSDDNTAKVWDTDSLALKATFPHRGITRSAAMSDKYIVISSFDSSADEPSEGNLYRTTVTVVRYAGDQCDELFELPVYEKICYPSKVAFLNNDVIILAMNICLFFISISKESVLSRVEMDTRIFSFDVARDGRIAVCGKDDFCAILIPPKSVQGAADASSSTERGKIQAPTLSEDDPDECTGLIAKLTISEESEMVRWKTKGVSKNSVQELESDNAAACFVAFLLNYETDSEEMFCQLKDSMKKVFKKKMIYGASFVEADEKKKKVLIDVLMTGLKDVTDEVATKLMEIWVKKFIGLAATEV